MLAVLSRWPATAAVAAAIVALSHVPPGELPPVFIFAHQDKVAHFLEYVVLGTLLFRSLLHQLGDKTRAAAIIAVSAGLAFGAADEWHQRLVGRSAEAWDVLADAAGLLCGTSMVVLARKRRHHNGE